VLVAGVAVALTAVLADRLLQRRPAPSATPSEARPAVAPPTERGEPAMRLPVPSRTRSQRDAAPARMDIALVAGIVLVLTGLLAIGVGWYRAGDGPVLWVQNQYLLSGGVGGLGLVVLGTGLIVASRISAGTRATVRLAEAIERSSLTGAEPPLGEWARAMDDELLPEQSR
jgi:hypothetical protein